MSFVNFSIGFLLIMLGILALCTIPYVLALAGKKHEEAEAQNVQTQAFVGRYNSHIKPVEKPTAPKPPNGKVLSFDRKKSDGHRKKDDDL